MGGSRQALLLIENGPLGRITIGRIQFAAQVVEFPWRAFPLDHQLVTAVQTAHLRNLDLLRREGEVDPFLHEKKIDVNRAGLWRAPNPMTAYV